MNFDQSNLPFLLRHEREKWAASCHISLELCHCVLAEFHRQFQESKNLTCTLYECQQDTFLIDFVNDLEKPPKFQPHFFHRIHGFIHNFLPKKDGIIIAPHFFLKRSLFLLSNQNNFEKVSIEIRKRLNFDFWSKRKFYPQLNSKYWSTISSACVNIYHVI